MCLILKEVVSLLVLREGVCLVLVEVVTEPRKEPLEEMVTDDVAVESRVYKQKYYQSINAKMHVYNYLI